MDGQTALAVMGTVAGVVSAYCAYAQHRKSHAPNTVGSDGDTLTAPPKETQLWSTAVEKALEAFRKGRRECTIEIAQQKNAELVLHVRYVDASDANDKGTTHRFELKINKNGDILEMESKGKRRSDGEKFR